MGCRLWGRTESDTAEATQQQQHQTKTKDSLVSNLKKAEYSVAKTVVFRNISNYGLSGKK